MEFADSFKTIWHFQNIYVSGTSYFPIGWREMDGSSDYDGSSSSSATTAGEDGDDVNGEFPLPGKQALGIRMFLFSTLIGQLAFTFASKFDNPIGRIYENWIRKIYIDPSKKKKISKRVTNIFYITNHSFASISYTKDYKWWR